MYFLEELFGSDTISTSGTAVGLCARLCGRQPEALRLKTVGNAIQQSERRCRFRVIEEYLDAIPGCRDVALSCPPAVQQRDHRAELNQLAIHRVVLV